jgi:hypothetical protein
MYFEEIRLIHRLAIILIKLMKSKSGERMKERHSVGFLTDLSAYMSPSRVFCDISGGHVDWPVGYFPENPLNPFL